MSAVDFSFARFTVAQLQAAGVTVSIRYLTGPGKAISAEELAADLFGGISVVLAFENEATDATGGFAVGVQYARAANAALLALGLPLATPVYFAADTDYPNPAAVVPYYQGLASVRPGPTNGCYGEAALIDLLFADGLVGFGWESESTSFPGNGALSPNVALWQKVNGAPLPGTDLDLVEKADFGQLPRPAQPSPLPAPPPPVHYPEDNVQAISQNVKIVGGKGWIPSPVPAAKVFSVVFLTEDPDVVGRYDSVPTVWSLATQPGKDAPNGAIVIEGMVADGTYGVVVWAAS